MSNFINDCIQGDALVSDVHDYIDQWHDSDDDISIFEYLGMTKSEYALFIEDEAYLPLIIVAHKDKENIQSIISKQISLAARADDQSKAKKLEMWLKNENLWE